MGLLLQAVDVVERFHWRWLLTDQATGAPLADHTATIDPASPEAEAFADLYRFLRWHAEPDRRLETETAWIDRLGAWIGEQILGATVGRAIVAAAPVAVRVVVPESAQFLLFRPLELAHVDGVPLARRGDVSLVFDIGRAAPGEKARVGERLRMLAVFSLPTDTTALALRRERYELTRLVRRLAARRRRAIDLEVLKRFVGRTRAMAASSAALAPSSGRTAVLFHGMAGAGKTACTLELAYRHQNAFNALVFWEAPKHDDEFGGALPNLALALET